MGEAGLKEQNQTLVVLRLCAACCNWFSGQQVLQCHACTGSSMRSRPSFSKPKLSCASAWFLQAAPHAVPPVSNLHTCHAPPCRLLAQHCVRRPARLGRCGTALGSGLGRGARYRRFAGCHVRRLSPSGRQGIAWCWLPVGCRGRECCHLHQHSGRLSTSPSQGKAARRCFRLLAARALSTILSGMQGSGRMQPTSASHWEACAAKSDAALRLRRAASRRLVASLTGAAAPGAPARPLLAAGVPSSSLLPQLSAACSCWEYTRRAEPGGCRMRCRVADSRRESRSSVSWPRETRSRLGDRTGEEAGGCWTLGGVLVRSGTLGGGGGGAACWSGVGARPEASSLGGPGGAAGAAPSVPAVSTTCPRAAPAPLCCHATLSAAACWTCGVSMARTHCRSDGGPGAASAGLASGCARPCLWRASLDSLESASARPSSGGAAGAAGWGCRAPPSGGRCAPAGAGAGTSAPSLPDAVQHPPAGEAGEPARNRSNSCCSLDGVAMWAGSAASCCSRAPNSRRRRARSCLAARCRAGGAASCSGPCSRGLAGPGGCLARGACGGRGGQPEDGARGRSATPALPPPAALSLDSSRRSDSTMPAIGAAAASRCAQVEAPQGGVLF